MYPFPSQWRTLSFVILAGLLSARIVAAADEPTLTKEQMKQFLLTAKVIKSGPAHKGITNTLRLTLTDGTITHDVHFQPIDEHAMMKEMDSGHKEFNFVDSYNNIAGYELAAMLGLDDMVPVYVQRNYDGKTGSFGWWLPVKMDVADRLKQKIHVPDPDSWNKQMYRVRVLDQLLACRRATVTRLRATEAKLAHSIAVFGPQRHRPSAVAVTNSLRQAT